MNYVSGILALEYRIYLPNAYETLSKVLYNSNLNKPVVLLAGGVILVIIKSTIELLGDISEQP